MTSNDVKTSHQELPSPPFATVRADLKSQNKTRASDALGVFSVESADCTRCRVREIYIKDDATRRDACRRTGKKSIFTKKEEKEKEEKKLFARRNVFPCCSAGIFIKSFKIASTEFLMNLPKKGVKNPWGGGGNDVMNF